jgi:NifU-like protein involved in Fe-S cluster formation
MDLYHEVIIEEYKNRQNVGTIPDADTVVEHGHVSCGDKLTVYLKFDGQKDRITNIKWQGEGCAISMAAMSVLSAKIQQEQPTLAQVHQWQQKDMEVLLGLNGISEARVNCLLLGLQTVQKAT